MAPVLRVGGELGGEGRREGEREKSLTTSNSTSDMSTPPTAESIKEVLGEEEGRGGIPSHCKLDHPYPWFVDPTQGWIH